MKNGNEDSWMAFAQNKGKSDRWRIKVTTKPKWDFEQDSQEDSRENWLTKTEMQEINIIRKAWGLSILIEFLVLIVEERRVRLDSQSRLLCMRVGWRCIQAFKMQIIHDELNTPKTSNANYRGRRLTLEKAMTTTKRRRKKVTMSIKGKGITWVCVRGTGRSRIRRHLLANMFQNTKERREQYCLGRLCRKKLCFDCQS